MYEIFRNIMLQNRKLLLTAAAVLTILALGCDSNLPREDYIGYNSFSLIDQEGTSLLFPSHYEGKILVIGFIFTHCPDICPLTVHNLQLIQEAVEKANIQDVQFAALTFDPDRDTPNVLKKFGEMRKINFTNFKFLTGNREIVLSLNKEMEVVVVSSDTTYLDDGTPSYFYTHTDRISLIDKRNRLRKEYGGSDINIDEILNDIKSLKE